MRRFAFAVAALAAVRVAIPVAQLVHADLPGLPRIRSHALIGDATGYYGTAREALAAPARLPAGVLVLLALLTLALVAAVLVLWQRRVELRPWLALCLVVWLGVLLAVDAAAQRFAGAPVVGWPLVWAVAMLPLRLLGRLDQSSAFWAGLPVQLACNAATVTATAVAGLRATGSRTVGVLAAALYAFWPFLLGLLGGHAAWGNGTWRVDAGLHMYTEPLSTALVAIALALLLAPRLTPLGLAAAGACLGYATATRLSNGLLAAVAAALVAWRCRRDRTAVAAYVVGGLAFAPLVLAYWRLGYARLQDNPRYWHAQTFGTQYLVRNWTHSLLFTPRTLLVLGAIAIVGTLVVRRRWQLALLASFTLVNAVFYSFYWYTPIHPRFLWASLPSLFVLWAAGAVLVVRRSVQPMLSGAGRGRGAREAPRSP